MRSVTYRPRGHWSRSVRSKPYTDVRSCCPLSTVRALVPKNAETSENQISKPPCGARSSPIPVSCGVCGGSAGAVSGGKGEGGEGGGTEGERLDKHSMAMVRTNGSKAGKLVEMRLYAWLMGVATVAVL